MDESCKLRLCTIKTLPKITRKMPALKCSSRMQPGTAEPTSSITANRDIVHPAMFIARLKTCTVFFHEPLLSTGVYNEKHHYFSLLNEKVQRASVKTTPDDLASLVFVAPCNYFSFLLKKYKSNIHCIVHSASHKYNNGFISFPLLVRRESCGE